MMDLTANHTGNELVDNLFFCETYNQKAYQGLWEFVGVPCIDVTTTKTDDTLFISIVKRDPENVFDITINSDYKFKVEPGRHYSCYNEYYWIKNTPETPCACLPTEEVVMLSLNLSVKEHSFNIFAFPLDTATDTGIPVPGISSIATAFPNPVDDLMLVELKGLVFENASIEIIDVTGRKKKAFNVDSGKDRAPLYMVGLAKGMYYVNIKSGTLNEFFPVTKKQAVT